MNDLDFLQESETTPDLPGLAWYAQAAGVFSATCAAVGALFVFALTGGWATFDSNAARASAASDLQDGQYYQEQWLDPATGRPFHEQIDEISTDFADLSSFADASSGEGWAAPLEGEAPLPAPAYDPVAFEDLAAAATQSEKLPETEIQSLPDLPRA